MASRMQVTEGSHCVDSFLLGGMKFFWIIVIDRIPLPDVDGMMVESS